MEITLTLKAEFSDHRGAIWETQVHPDGRLFFARSDDMLILYDLEQEKKIRGFYDSAGFQGAEFSSDGKYLVYYSDEKLHYWSLMSWAETMVIPGELREVRKIDADIGAGLWAKGEEDGSISLRGLNMEEEDPPEFSLKGHSGWLEIIRFHPSGKFLASGASDKTIRFWDIEEKTEVASFEVHDDYVTAIGFSPDGRIMVSGDYSGHLKVWDLSVSRSS